MKIKKLFLLILTSLSLCASTAQAVQTQEININAPEYAKLEAQTSWCRRHAQNVVTLKIDTTYFLFVENASLFVCYSVNSKNQIDTERIVRKNEPDAPQNLDTFVETFFQNEYVQ